MSARTTITHPDGTVTRIDSRSSFGCVNLFLALFVIAAPATFAAPWNVLAYVVVGLLAVAAVGSWLIRRRGVPR